MTEGGRQEIVGMTTGALLSLAVLADSEAFTWKGDADYSSVNLHFLIGRKPVGSVGGRHTQPVLLGYSFR